MKQLRHLALAAAMCLPALPARADSFMRLQAILEGVTSEVKGQCAFDFLGTYMPAADGVIKRTQVCSVIKKWGRSRKTYVLVKDRDLEPETLYLYDEYYGTQEVLWESQMRT